VAGPPLAEKKARYRRASALHGLRRFERALEEYTRVLDMDSDQDNALFGKAAVEMALEQSREGTYGWDQIDPLALKRIRRNDPLTMGDFFGPIKVVDMPQRQGGRGVIATRDIDAGELLLRTFYSALSARSAPLIGVNLQWNYHLLWDHCG
jgi:tetratricopeptide (TPR) repeat protein